MPCASDDALCDLEQWFQEEHHHLWTAYQGSDPVGYCRIEPDGESFVAEHPQMINITGAYVRPDCRCRGVGVNLLNTVQGWLLDHGYRWLGVDFESINVIGSRFWNKHFTPYIFSWVRRIDERVLGSFRNEEYV